MYLVFMGSPPLTADWASSSSALLSFYWGLWRQTQAFGSNFAQHCFSWGIWAATYIFSGHVHHMGTPLTWENICQNFQIFPGISGTAGPGKHSKCHESPEQLWSQDVVLCCRNICCSAEIDICFKQNASFRNWLIRVMKPRGQCCLG